MVKRCCWGTCNSDTRYPERLAGGIIFIPFPKPARNFDRCQRWIRLCGRPKYQLNMDILRDHSRGKHFFVCTKHFVHGKPSKTFPDPVSALPHEQNQNPKTVRPRPKPRLPLADRKKKVLLETHRCYHGNASNDNVDSPDQTTMEHQESTTKQQDSDDLVKQSDTMGPLPLDMLALAAENKQLKEDMARLILQKEELMRAQHCSNKFSDKNIKHDVYSFCKNIDKKDYKYYTGFPYEQFQNILKFVVPDHADDEPFQFTRTVSSLKCMDLEDQLLLVLIKLRQNFDFKHLSKLFLISPQDCSTAFSNWINYLYYRFGSVSIWPHRDVLQQHMPLKFREEFPNTFSIIDGTELKIQRPSSLTRQSQAYSDYKSSTTLKGLIGVDPRGSITFISMLCSGAISDQQITEKSGYLSLLREMVKCGKLKVGDGVMADKGFNIEKEIRAIGLRLNIPPFAPSEGQMCVSDVTETVKIATHRVVVENAIGRVKKFKIVGKKLHLSLFSSVIQIWFVCCFLTNFMPYLINDKD